jgi:hypothetical protein
MVPGPAVSDVVHLLAELIENAMVFSASDTQVQVSVQALASGGVLIQVSDGGVGVSAARLAELNARLDDPPAIDVSVSRHMGLFAVARLAERHGVRVRLRAGTPQGLTALVWLPDSLAERETRRYDDAPERLATFQARHTPGRHATTASPPKAAAPAARAGAGAGTVQTLPAADSATSSWFRSQRSPEFGAFPPPGGGRLPVADDWGTGRHAAQVVANPVRGDRTVAGMPVRVPRANLLPGSQADEHGGRTPAAFQPLSPETARSRLSGFQRGARRAEDQIPRAGERADR